MSNRDLYRCTFVQVHSAKIVKWEDMEQMTQTKKNKRPLGRLLPLAAVIALLALLGGTAVAVNLLGLRDALLPRQKEVNVIDPDTGLMIPGERTQIDVISLSGFADTPESKALAEWEDFLESYDPDKAILNSVGNTLDPELFEKYGCYCVYTQEMGTGWRSSPGSTVSNSTPSRSTSAPTRRRWGACAISAARMRPTGPICTRTGAVTLTATPMWRAGALWTCSSSGA